MSIMQRLAIVEQRVMVEVKEAEAIGDIASGMRHLVVLEHVRQIMRAIGGTEQ